VNKPIRKNTNVKVILAYEINLFTKPLTERTKQTIALSARSDGCRHV